MNFLQVFKDSYVQLFDDRKYWGHQPPFPPFRKCFPMSELNAEVRELNDKGVGVYFTPNPCKGGRKQEDLTAIEWVFIDMDDGTKEQQQDRILKSPLPPTMIIESLRGYHCYWRYSDGTAENFKQIIKGLILHFNADMSISSPNEVLRFPEFLHNKYENNRFKVKVVHYDEASIYTSAQLKEAFPEPVERWLKQFDNVDIRLLKDIPIKTVMQKLGIPYNQKNQLIENGEPTSALINTKENYINRFSGKPPCGSTIDVVMYALNTDTKGAVRWLIDNYYPPKEITPQLAVKADYPLRYTWGTPNLDKRMAILKREKLTVLYGMQGQGKTTYIFDMAIKNAKLGHKVLFYSLEMEKEPLVSTLCSRFAGITIEEEYAYKIPEYKLELAEKKRREFEGINNLIFYGMRKEADKTWDTILESLLKFNDLDMIIIDNLDTIEGSKGESENARQARIVTDMATFVTKYKIPIILIHHKRKFVSGGKTQGMDDMSGSGRIPRIADYVVRLLRDSAPDLIGAERYKTTLHLEKAREYNETIEEIYFRNGTFIDDWDEAEDKDALIAETNRIFNS